MTFKDTGIAVVRNIYDVNNHTLLCPNLFEYMISKSDEGHTNDEQSPGAPSFYKNLELNKMQIKMLPIMEKETGLKLYPTYNYSRIYNEKSILKAHDDRPACEISVTINLGYREEYNWPIWIIDLQGERHEVTLEVGDGLIYLGHELKHWRDDSAGRVTCQVQAFLHYVKQDSKFEDLIFDPKKGDVYNE